MYKKYTSGIYEVALIVAGFNSNFLYIAFEACNSVTGVYVVWSRVPKYYGAMKEGMEVAIH